MKAVIYLYLGNTDLSIEQVTVIRSALGPVSFIALLGGERLMRPQIIKGLMTLGKIPASEMDRREIV